MFKYGGPIKEGLMHGMKNGGNVGAFNVGSPVKGMFPKDATGREHHVGPGLLALPYIGAGLRMAARPFGSWAMKNLPKMFAGPGKPTWNIGKGFSSTPGFTKNVAQNVFTKNKLGKYFMQSPEAALVTGGAGWAGKAGKGIYSAGKWVGKSPLTVGGLMYAGGKWYTRDGKEANDNDLAKAAAASGKKPGHGDEGMYYEKPPVTKSAEELAAEAKAARTKKLNKYLDTMGYDKAKKTAMGDALIDASAIVQDATTEAGSLKKADWGKMINKAIQTTSKRLDKPEQIREAVGLMLTKSEIEKDLEDPQVKKLRALEIEKGEKALSGLTTGEILQQRMLKGDYPSGKNLARTISIKNPGLNIRVIPSTGMDVDVDTIDYITKVVEKSHKEGKPYPAGVYVIKDRIIQVDETGTVTPIPISSLN